jgi:hypothetical protein
MGDPNFEQRQELVSQVGSKKTISSAPNTGLAETPRTPQTGE